MDNQEYLSLKELCQQLSINQATGRNWLKLNKISCQASIAGKPFFAKAYVEDIKNKLNATDNKLLKSRRNKKYISGNSIYSSYISDNSVNIKYVINIIDYINEKNIVCDDFVVQIIIADCSLKLLNKINKLRTTITLLEYLNNGKELKYYNKLIDSLILNRKKAVNFIKKNLELFKAEYEYVEGEDLLGLIYLSCRNIGNRKLFGAYYTPTKVVEKLILDTFDNKYSNEKILDPCCGTGNFLLQLPDYIDINNIYGNDIDEISVKIARINLALKYKLKNLDVLYKNITCSNFISDYKLKEFDYIIGNPPWGYCFTLEEKKSLSKQYLVAKSKAVESYDVFLEESLKRLIAGGVVSFVLPEAILNVKSHCEIRRIIANTCNIKKIVYLENIFHKVQCPSVILKLEFANEALTTKGMSVEKKGKKYIIKLNRKVDYKVFDFNISDEEYKVLEKIYSTNNCTNLNGQSTFALGIVTGNNAEYITKYKTKKNEVIVKGTEVFKYKIGSKNNFIEFKPERFQQVAKEELYRAKEKLFYRFISNQLIFAYDDRGRLSLNSCNILIPKISGLNIKYILAVLNSRIAQFVYKNKFNSVKVLRAHIENIPIPIIASNKQRFFIDLVDKIMKCSNQQMKMQIYNEIDVNIANLYNLSKKEYEVIVQSTDNNLKNFF